ncbi:M48 family metallopeptidase [Micromonospora echinospora]|uniref:M48 family metallopeptidase n=1 Tax=Micromonospora echinospora TaxID=1877 RepID=UPI0033C02BF8
MAIESRSRRHRLPGGLSTWWGRWLTARRSGAVWFAVWLVALLVVVPVTAPFVVGVGLLSWVAARVGPRGAAVGRQDRPELYALVEQVAAGLGTRPPDRVWLTAEPVVAAEVVAGRSHLSIGLPLLDCLTPARLRALVGYQLALLRHRHPGLVIDLLAVWSDSVREETGAEGRRQSRAAALRTRLDAFATEVQRTADEAAVAAAGDADLAAEAFTLADMVAEKYDGFLTDSGVPERRWWRLYEVSVSDVTDGWRRMLSEGPDRADWDEDDAALLARLHPRLGSPLTALGISPPSIRPAPDAVPVTPLTRHEQRRTVRRLRGIPYPQYIRWTTFEEAPTSWWRRRARQDAQGVREAVAAVLGREPVDDVEVTEVVWNRPREVLAAALDVPVTELPEDPADPTGVDDPPEALLRLVEENLLRRGWRLEHPAVRGVLLGPTGERVSAWDVLAATRRDPAALRRWYAADSGGR